MYPSRWVCVLAGGQGSRLASLTETLYTDGRPKQFCALHGPQTLIEQTLDRAAMLVEHKHICISLCQEHMRWHGLFAHYRNAHLSVQPRNAGTGPAVLWATLQIAQKNPTAIVALFPSDHFISNDFRWIAKVREAMMWVERHPEMFVMLGVKADFPETEYGWLLPRTHAPKQPPPWPAEFIEKPGAHKAKQLLELGGFWNTMVTVFRCDILLRMMALLQPAWWKTLQQAAEQDQEALMGAYSGKEPFDFSRDILEACSHRTQLLPVHDVGWCDLGSQERLLYALERWPARPLYFVPPALMQRPIDTPPRGTQTPFIRYSPLHTLQDEDFKDS